MADKINRIITGNKINWKLPFYGAIGFAIGFIIGYIWMDTTPIPKIPFLFSFAIPGAIIGAIGGAALGLALAYITKE